MKHGICFIFSLLFSSVLCAQNPTTDEQLAAQYYQNKEYAKAVVYYEKLYDKKPIELYYNYYLSCLLELKEYKDAEKMVKKHIKKTNEELKFYVDLGVIYASGGDENKCKAEWDGAIKKLKENQQQIFDLANQFLKIKQYDYALATYEKGEKLIKTYPFNFEIANVYMLKGDVQRMIEKLLDVLAISDAYLDGVQNTLQPNFGTDADAKKNEIIRTELLKRIQKYPDKNVFSELLVWMLLQQRDFDAALTQVKALDKRNKEDGYRVFNLGKICASNENYDVAAKCFQYLIAKGNNYGYYIDSRMELLNVMYKKITSQNSYTAQELTTLEKDYESTINELGRFSSTVTIIKDLAHLQAFYLHKTDEALKLLDDALELPGISETLLAQCKLERGDILLMMGEVWESSITYSQVEKAFKNDIIGQEAKYRNAKLSYFIADFKWAQAQLDVLKGATTKLIANDAMDLSLMISDNLAIDTNPEPLAIFARADLLEFQNKDSLAGITLDSLEKNYPGHSLSDDILYKRYSINYKKKKYSECALYLESIIHNHDDDLLGDDATFKLAELYEYKLNDKEKAKEFYQQLITKHPDSLYTVEARKRFRKLRGDTVN
jgi:tetratricopeptide (TPR) repeat protein